MKKAEEDHKPPEDAAFQKVVRYFLGHSKPKDKAEPPKRKAKATKRAPRKQPG